MVWYLRAGLVLVLFAIVGCAQDKNDVPASPQVLAAIRKQVTATNPQAIVAAVTAVEPGGRPFAAVGDVPTAQIHEGEPITFMDSNQNMLTHGIVRRILPNAVHVQWYPPTGGQRAPRVGDVAIRYRPIAVPMTPTPMTPTPEPSTPTMTPAPTTPAPTPSAPTTPVPTTPAPTVQESTPAPTTGEMPAPTPAPTTAPQ